MNNYTFLRDAFSWEETPKEQASSGCLTKLNCPLKQFQPEPISRWVSKIYCVGYLY